MRLLRGLVLVLFGALAARADGFDALTRSKLQEALACVNLATSDLSWDKRPINDDFRLSCVNETLDHPLLLADRAERAEREFADDSLAAASSVAAWLDVPPQSAPPQVIAEAGIAGPAGSLPRRILGLLLAARRQAEAAREDSLKALSKEERALIQAQGASLYADESDDDRDLTALLAAAKKVDLASLVRAEIILARAAEQARAMAAGADVSAWKSGSWTLDGVTVELGGPGADVHHAQVVLDGGGDDAYDGSSYVVDLAGDDTYRNCGSGKLATGLVLDLAGDDRYLGADFVEGAATFGASLLVDVAGDDRYEAGQCSQGAGVVGVGLLFDLAGNDSYRGTRFDQGFGGVRGLGALSDMAGNDTYYAGGKYSHAPLLPENFQSLSQGFGFGLRPDASGGVGILADHAGNDIYSAEVFGQGASYWFSLGILVDSAGHDHYDLYQYGQGAGIHLSAGVLFDRAGNDAYSCPNGVAQGSGHDWGCGLLWDLSGNDCYQGSGMSQGGANANAVGMLVDRDGNDSYAGWNMKNQGDSFFSRGTFGLGVLLDLGGADKYTHGGKDDATWTNGTVGVGLDWAPPPAPEVKR